MENYRRDDFWDAATWADIDQAALAEAQQIRVARKVFRTEDLSTATEGAPFWISRAPVVRAAGLLLLPESDAQPFIEISAPFQLTPAQADAESTLHTARTLARMAAMRVARAEDEIILRGPAFLRSALATNTAGILGVGGRSRARVLSSRMLRPTDPQKLLDTVSDEIAVLGANGWPEPYALVLGQNLYQIAFERLSASTEETPQGRLKDRLKHLSVSGALHPDNGFLASLSGESVTIYTAREVSTSFTHESLAFPRGALYNFRVFARIQFVVRDTESIVRLEL
ncbi:MAG: family 1 encapsulin nanocompartment shell protein [Solirubrobacteraceae bacterium]